MYRGRGSKDARQQRLLPDGSLCVKLPDDADADYLHVARSYKHIGSVVADDRSLAEDAKLRARSALSAYAPLACRLFSSDSITAPVKLDFARSLVFCRLLYNMHLWQAEKSFAVRTINPLYMRVLRATSGRKRFKRSCGSDYEGRSKLGQPSMVCFFAQKRLM